MNLLRLLIFWIIFVFLCFPSNAYDEKIKLNRTDNKIISGETKIKINLNNMLNFRKIKQINKNYALTEHYVNETSNGLAHAVEKFKEFGITGHVTFKKGERSEVATLASKVL